MRLALRTIIPDDIRRLARTFRELHLIEDDDGYYHISVRTDAYEILLRHPQMIELLTFMTPESRMTALKGEGINGFYGIKITIDKELDKILNPNYF